MIMFKNIKRYGLLILIAAMTLSSCVKKDARYNNYPAPVIPEPAEGVVFTIGQLLDVWREAGTPKDYENDTIFKDDCSVYGIVTDDETSGNLYKASFIQDRAEGEAIELYLKGVSGLRIGDSVRVYLKGATLGAYRGTPQIKNLDPINIIVLKNEQYIEPTVVNDINEIENHLCQIVRLENVQFLTPDTTWADPDGYGERTLQQFDENGGFVGEMMVRTSNYAAFAEKRLPQGSGYLNAIVTVYVSSNETWQLVVRGVNPAEVLMEGPRYN